MSVLATVVLDTTSKPSISKKMGVGYVSLVHLQIMISQICLITQVG